MKKTFLTVLILTLALSLLLSSCIFNPLDLIKKKPAETTTAAAPVTTAPVTTAAPATTAATTAAATTTAATTTTAAAATAAATTAATTAGPAYVPLFNRTYLYGGWLCDELQMRLEFDEYDNCVFAGYHDEEACWGSWMFDGRILMASLYDPEGDAYITISFDAAADSQDMGAPLHLTYRQEAHDFNGMTAGETYDFYYTDELYWLLPEDDSYLYVSFPVEYYEGSYDVRIPFINCDFESEAIASINSDFQDMEDELFDFLQSNKGPDWLEWIPEVTETEDAIQITMLRNMYPSYGTDGTLQTWYYDIPTDTVYTLEEAVDQTEPDFDRIAEAVESIIPEYEADWDSATLCGFYVVDPYLIDFYVQLPIAAPEAEEWDTIFTVRYDLDHDSYSAWYFAASYGAVG